MPNSDADSTLHGMIASRVGQSRGQPEALAEGFFYVDELSFEDLLALGRSIAARLRFYNLENQESGTWERLFTSDEAVIMAMVLRFDVAALKTRMRNLSCQDVQSQWRFVMSTYGELDSYYRFLTSGRTVMPALITELRELIIQRLAPRWRALQTLSQGFEEDELAGTDSFQSFDPIWQQEIQASVVQVALPDTSELEDHEEARDILHAALHSLRYGFERLQTLCVAYFKESLHSQEHEPAISLFMVFLRLFQQAQNRVNAFTQKHLDFFYRDVLYAKVKPAKPERACLGFSLEPGAEEVATIEKGTAFSHGKDRESQDIIYRADHELRVTDAAVVAVKTLYLQRDPRIYPEKYFNFVTQIKKNGLVLPSTKQQEIPLFGVDKTNATQASGVNADLGFALSSVLLRLKEGCRRIEMTVHLSEPYFISTHHSVGLGHLDSTSSEEDLEKWLRARFGQFLKRREPVNACVHEEKGQQAGDLYNVLEEKLPSALKRFRSFESVDQRLFSYKLFLLGRFLLSTRESDVLQVLHEILSRYLLYHGQAWLTDGEKNTIYETMAEFEKEGTVVPGEGQEDHYFSKLFLLPQGELFDKFFGQLFQVRLSSEYGWREVKPYQVKPLSTARGTDGRDPYGFKIIFCLTPAFPAVVPVSAELHGTEWAQAHEEPPQPVVQFRVGAFARCYPYSLF